MKAVVLLYIQFRQDCEWQMLLVSVCAIRRLRSSYYIIVIRKLLKVEDVNLC